MVEQTNQNESSTFQLLYFSLKGGPNTVLFSSIGPLHFSCSRFIFTVRQPEQIVQFQKKINKKIKSNRMAGHFQTLEGTRSQSIASLQDGCLKVLQTTVISLQAACMRLFASVVYICQEAWTHTDTCFTAARIRAVQHTDTTCQAHAVCAVVCRSDTHARTHTDAR